MSEWKVTEKVRGNRGETNREGVRYYSSMCSKNRGTARQVRFKIGGEICRAMGWEVKDRIVVAPSKKNRRGCTQRFRLEAEPEWSNNGFTLCKNKAHEAGRETYLDLSIWMTADRELDYPKVANSVECGIDYVDDALVLTVPTKK